MMLPGGLAAGHAIGYQAAAHAGASATTGGHGYLGQLSLLAVPLTLAVLVRAVVAGIHHELAPLRFRSLAAHQVALYVGVELVEHALSGTDPMSALVERSLLLGVVAQLIVAAGFALVVQALRRLGVAVAAATPRMVGARRPHRPWPVVTSLDGRPLLALVCAPRRGPPSRSIFA